MRAWFKKSKDTYGTAQKWEQGWKEGTKYEGPADEESFQPIYSGNETRAASSSIECEIDNADAWRITYRALIPQSIVEEAVYRNETYRFSVADTLMADAKHISALTRGMMAIPLGGKQSAGRKHNNYQKTTAVQRTEHLMSGQHFLLRFGGMRLFPSARRDWTGEVKSLRLVATNGITADLSTTFMLDMLEKASAGRNNSTDYICKALDKAGENHPIHSGITTCSGPTYFHSNYQKTTAVRRTNTPDERADFLLRFGGMRLFPSARRDWTGEVKILRLVATNGITADLSTTFMLDMLEKASAGRNNSTDYICKALDKADIPLRLDA
ncbi:unnamed protein product [Mytilus coruscus]|uniref:Uncharacterized protein n=1 Tax=Mytilus coruscus TaxID=42192 RepID=A0A6J8CY46_MYTCO|nr:unnamed protein product [Mytilus coruscus]